MHHLQLDVRSLQCLRNLLHQHSGAPDEVRTPMAALRAGACFVLSVYHMDHVRASYSLRRGRTRACCRFRSSSSFVALSSIARTGCSAWISMYYL